MNGFLAKCTRLLVLIFSSQSSQAQLHHIVFTPQWHANVQFAGYIAARELGFYRDEGLDVTIKYPEGAKSSLELLRDGQADLVLGFLMNAIVMKTTQDVDMVNVMQTSQHASLCLALKEPMDEVSIENLKGKRIGLWSSQTAISAVAMNNRYNLGWKITYFRNGIELLSYGVMDAISVMEYNELLRMRYAGKDVSSHSVLRMCDFGYDIPEEGVYCQRAYYEQHAQQVEAFIRATKKGWEWTRQHPEEAVDMVTKEMHTEYVSNSKVFQTAGLKVVLEKQEVTPGQIGYRLLPEQYEQATNTLLEAKLIQTIPEFKSFIAQ